MALADFATARNMMVDGQVRPNKVNDPRIIAAMRDLPRERFLPPELVARAYCDEDIALGGGRALMEPMVIARLIQSMTLKVGESVLVAACGTGYSAALLASCGGTVTAFEEDAALLAIARTALSTFATGVKLVPGTLTQGYPGEWDVILIEGAVPANPPAYAALLKPGVGRLLTVIGDSNRIGRAVMAEPNGEGLATQTLFDCATPVLPALQRPPSFAF